MKLSVVVPVYNESRYVTEILARISAVKVKGVKKEIVVVDDCSTDGTLEKLKRIKGIRLILHERNKGKGAAIRTGLQHAAGDIILFQDADSEYDPADYPALVAPIIEKRAIVVYGSRFIGKSLKRLGHGKLILPSHFLGNKLLTFITNILYAQSLTDMETGYKVFRADVIKNLNFRSTNFDMEPEITAKVLKKRIRIFEVPIKYAPRTFEEGKKITWRDGARAAWCLVKYRFVD